MNLGWADVGNVMLSYSCIVYCSALLSRLLELGGKGQLRAKEAM